MAEHERDEEIRKRYRELPREEPPRALDETILAAARRELETRPAPLVAPTGRRRWMFPLAAAAVIVLSAVITLQIQREQPDMELATAPPPAAPPAASKDERASAAPRPEAEKERPSRPKSGRSQVARDQAPAAQSPSLADRAQSKPAEESRRVAPEPAPAPQAAQQPAPAAAAAARSLGERDSRESASQTLSRRAEATAAKRADSTESPERMLERIAALRREGHHKEADDLYAEFRRRFPEYKIPEAMREQVLPR